MKIVLLFMAIFFPIFVWAQEEKLLFEALLANVGNENILLSDLQRYQEVQNVMVCAGLRRELAKNAELLPKVLNRYIDEELLYFAAANKRQEATGLFQQSIKKIQNNPLCYKQWKYLGESYAKLWNTNQKSRSGEIQILRELEKRLLIDQYVARSLKADRETWLRETKLKTPIQIFLQ